MAALFEVFANLPAGTVSSGGTGTPSAGTAETWTVSVTAAFAALTTGSQHFYAADKNSPGEVFEVTACPGGTGSQSWTVTRGADGTAVTAHSAGFPVVQVAGAQTLRTLQYKPWQFPADSYGARGDGIVCTVNTNGTTTITATSAVFTSTAVDGGKYIMIHGGNGTTSGPKVTTISSVTDSTHAVVASAPSATASACPAVFGTDDTSAINSAISAASTYAQANSYFAEVLFGAKTYVLGTGPTQTGNGTTTPTFNAQIPLPYPNVNGTTQKMVLALTGAGDAGYCQYWESLIPNLAGTSLVSMTYPGSTSGTFGVQSVIGGPSGSAGFTGGYANLKVIIKGISVWCGIYTNQYAYDFGFVSAMRVTQSSAQVFAPTGVNTGAVLPYLNNITATAFTNSAGSGFRTPVGGNNDDIVMDDVNVEGYECHYRISDHFNAGRLASVYSDVAVKWDSSQGTQGGTQHGLFIQSISAEAYNGGLLTSGGACQVNINWDCETPTPAYDLNVGSSLYGIFRYGDKVDNRAPIISGGDPGNLKIINENLPPGHWSGAPSVPASTTAQQNTAWRDASIVVHAGAGVTVSAISIDGTSTGLTIAASSSLALPLLPSGKNVTLTYAGGTPTWDWWLA